MSSHGHTQAAPGSSTDVATNEPRATTAAASGAVTVRRGIVLTPAKFCRKHSLPPGHKVKRAKTSKKKDTKADQYEVSLGTESGDSDDFDDPE